MSSEIYSLTQVPESWRVLGRARRVRSTPLRSEAVILDEPGALSVRALNLVAPGADDVVVETRWSGISTGTEKLFWQGRMPWFPGHGYPLVPGYEGVGEVVEAGANAGVTVGTRVLVPGASCYEGARGLFGASASHVVVPGARVSEVSTALGVDAVLLPLAATAHHAIAASPHVGQTLVVGHGVVGRLIARLLIARGDPAPLVWESDPNRRRGAMGYDVIGMDEDPCEAHATIFDASGDSTILDPLVRHLSPKGEIVLAGFYSEPLSFAFPPAFMREARFRIAAEFTKADMDIVRALVDTGALNLDGLITHHRAAASAADAYQFAFSDPGCLKMVLDWSDAA